MSLGWAPSECAGADRSKTTEPPAWGSTLTRPKMNRYMSTGVPKVVTTCTCMEALDQMQVPSPALPIQTWKHPGPFGLGLSRAIQGWPSRWAGLQGWERGSPQPWPSVFQRWLPAVPRVPWAANGRRYVQVLVQVPNPAWEVWAICLFIYLTTETSKACRGEFPPVSQTIPSARHNTLPSHHHPTSPPSSSAWSLLRLAWHTLVRLDSRSKPHHRDGMSVG